jgi:hypothetical protein
VRRPSAPRAPRRVSGPLSGLVRGRVITRPQRAGAAAPAAAPSARPRTARREPLTARAVAYIRALPQHSLLDRIIRGRAWIPLLGVLLAGIVAMQVEVLKLGASIGRSIETGTALQSRNEILRASVATLGDDARIEKLAAGMGMVMPAPTAVKFLAARGGDDVQRAISNIHAPDATAFMAQLPASDLSASGAGTSAAVTATPAAATTATTVPASATAAQTTPSTGSSAPTTTATSSTPISSSATGATPGQGTGSTPTTTSVPAATTTTSLPAATTAPTTAATGAGTGTSGQTGSSGGATPTGG